jgi:signal transduction histidine kinase
MHAGYEERRRLERDLHDGAQQRLVTLGLALRLAQRRHSRSRTHQHAVVSPERTKAVAARQVVGADPLDDLVDSTVAELATAVDELRQIAHGLRPSSLDDGLGAALAMVTGRVPDSLMRVELDVSPEVRTIQLPDVVAATAYFVASEAVTNAVKHADAKTLVVRASRLADAVVIHVRDDGCGGARPTRGSGLAGLMDRVAAVGGQLSVHSPPGSGTTVEAVLPCAW